MATDLENARSGNHVPALDGVRGLAILAVLTYHGVFYSGSRSSHVVDATFRQLMSCGWAGVDLFFVLSGFLITGILLDSRESPQYYRSFYARRVLRIFPLYFVFLASFIWLLPLVREMEPQFATMKQEQVWYWTYLINVRVAMEGWPEVKLLGHFWSLAVEEQFYLVWPFVVLSFNRTTLYRICVGCIVGSLALRIWLLFNGLPVAAYVLPFARLDSLAMGGLLAIWVRDPGAYPAVARYAPKVLLACSGLIAGIFVIKGAFWPWGRFVHTLGLSIVAVASSSLIATVLFRPDATWLGGVFRSSPMRFLGKYSYGIYVVHHPVIMILGRSRLGASEWPTWGGAEILGQLFVLVAGGAFSIILALVSWNLLEAPMLRLKDRFPYWPS
jgi:peptidoglycan/LPS O-acetylase OafA/YrhL